MLYKLNEQQYFDMEMETEADTLRVVETWIQDAPTPERYEVYNIGWTVQWRYPIWAGRTRGTVNSASWAAIWPSGNNTQ